MATILVCHVTCRGEFQGIFIIKCDRCPRSHDHIINNQEYAHSGHNYIMISQGWHSYRDLVLWVGISEEFLCSEITIYVWYFHIIFIKSLSYDFLSVMCMLSGGVTFCNDFNLSWIFMFTVLHLVFWCCYNNKHIGHHSEY